MSEIKKTDGSFVYQLNAAGANKWCFSVQPGFDDDGKRTSEDELESVATKMAAVDDLMEALGNLVGKVTDIRGVDLSFYAEAELLKSEAALAKARGEK